MGQAQINVRTRACSGTFIARTKQAALTHNVRGKRLKGVSYLKYFHDLKCRIQMLPVVGHVHGLRETLRVRAATANVTLTLMKYTHSYII